MMAVGLDFVDIIDSAPTVRLDLDDGTDFRLLQNPDFSPPPIKRAVADSGVLRDGAEIPADAYDNRIIRCRLAVEASTEDGLATLLQKLHRELDRSTNILRFDSGQTDPVFFRTFRSPEYVLDMEHGPPRATVELAILAEPFAYGLKEEVGPVTIDADPAAGANGLFMDITGVKGDVPTPALIQVESSAREMWAIRQHGTPSDLVFFQQAEDMTLGTDTASVSDLTASGDDAAETDFAGTATMTTRVSGSIPPTATPTAAQLRAARGLYRVLGVLRTTDGTGATTVRVKMVAPTDPAHSHPEIEFGSQEEDEWVVIDFGIIQVPQGPLPSSPGPSGIEPGARAVDVEFQAARDAGTGDLRWDFFCWFPADEYLWMTKDEAGLGASYHLWMDAYQDMVYTAINTWEDDAEEFGGITTELTGKLPLLKPNQTNRLFLIPSNDAARFGWGVDDSRVVRVHHWPRYLFVNPGT